MRVRPHAAPARLIAMRLKWSHDNDVVYGGYTQWELESAYKSVINWDDPRGPILADVPEAQANLVDAAITFYTATEAYWQKSHIPGMSRVFSEGYRNGPAGP